jgi:hypothetical protein
LTQTSSVSHNGCTAVRHGRRGNSPELGGTRATGSAGTGKGTGRETSPRRTHWGYSPRQTTASSGARRGGAARERRTTTARSRAHVREREREKEIPTRSLAPCCGGLAGEKGDRRRRDLSGSARHLRKLRSGCRLGLRFQGRLGAPGCSLYSHGEPRAAQLEIDREAAADSGSSGVRWGRRPLSLTRGLSWSAAENGPARAVAAALLASWAEAHQ